MTKQDVVGAITDRQFAGLRLLLSLAALLAIIVASGRLGADAGVAVTVVSTLAFVSVGYFATPHGVHELNRLLLRPASLILLGYVLTYWARAEQSLRRKLQLLREVSLTANPRFGVDRTAGEFMKRVLDFF